MIVAVAYNEFHHTSSYSHLIDVELAFLKCEVDLFYANKSLNLL
jgi:hypothetical protein